MDDKGIISGAIGLAAISVALVWGVISPRSLWMQTQGWRFKDPEANEPSDTMYSLIRVGSAIGVCSIVCVGCGIASTAIGS